MPSRRRTRRILAVSALASAVFTVTTLVTATGLAHIGTGSRPPAQPAITVGTAARSAHHHHFHSGGPELCRVTLRAPRPNRGRPLIVVLGASYTAGVGASTPAGSWAVRLAELLGARALTLGVPGAGYTEPGAQHLGPLTRELQRADVPALHPSLVVIQAGHDDWDVPPATETRNVTALVRRLMTEAPRARLAFLTVFSRPGASGFVLAHELAVDAAIVSAVHKTDPRAIVIDPLREHWQFPRFDGGLHPDTAGHLLIAERVAHALLHAVGHLSGQESRAQSQSVPHLSPASVSCTSL
jgi:lysophospholipase L1-like esterase